jgi:hypothetical protein
MFQPFLPLTKEFLDGLVKLNKVFLVSQSYPRGADHFILENRIPILFTDYAELGQAQIHLSAVKGDKLAAIVDLRKPEHKEKIMNMFSTNADHFAYWSVVKDKEDIQKRLERRYVDNIRRYVDKHTNWRIGSNDGLNVAMQIIYGEIFVDLRYRTHQIRIKFEDIEKI